MGRRNVDQDARVRCPYYKCENRCVIYCEGVVPEQCIHMAFGSKTGRRDYQRRFCRGHWSDCMIAGGHNSRWDYEEGGGILAGSAC